MGQCCKSMKLLDNYDGKISHFQLLVEIYKSLRKQIVGNRHVTTFLVTLGLLFATVFICL